MQDGEYSCGCRRQILFLSITMVAFKQFHTLKSPNHGQLTLHWIELKNMTVAALLIRDATTRDATFNHSDNEKPDTFVNLYFSYCTSLHPEAAKNTFIVPSSQI
jgi:hypothetical protein